MDVNKLQYYDLIEAYFENEMPNEKRMQFEKDLQTNSALKKEYSTYEDSLNLLNEYSYFQLIESATLPSNQPDISDLPNSGKSNNLWKFFSIGLLITTLGLLYLVLSPKSAIADADKAVGANKETQKNDLNIVQSVADAPPIIKEIIKKETVFVEPLNTSSSNIIVPASYENKSLLAENQKLLNDKDSLTGQIKKLSLFNFRSAKTKDSLSVLLKSKETQFRTEIDSLNRLITSKLPEQTAQMTAKGVESYREVTRIIDGFEIDFNEFKLGQGDCKLKGGFRIYVDASIYCKDENNLYIFCKILIPELNSLNRPSIFYAAEKIPILEIGDKDKFATPFLLKTTSHYLPSPLMKSQTYVNNDTKSWIEASSIKIRKDKANNCTDIKMSVKIKPQTITVLETI